jgi:hypothetical protein
VSAALLAWTVVAVGIAGCIAQPPEPSGPRSSQASNQPALSSSPTTRATEPVEASLDANPSADGTSSTADPITVAACQLRTQPGPADAAPTKGDLTDWSHVGGGRWRLCLGGAEPVELEGTAWCTWNEPRDAVREVSGLPVRVDAATGEIDGAVLFDPGIVYLALTRRSGDVGSWQGGPVGQEIRSHDQGRRGIARFDVAPVVDSEHPPAVIPSHVVGLMRWACLEPPVG